MTYHGQEMKYDIPGGCVAMTWADAEEAEAENARDRWGFSVPTLLRMVADHMEANTEADAGSNAQESYRKAEKIEWRLEDANFHTLRKALKENDYDAAVKFILKEIM